MVGYTEGTYDTFLRQPSIGEKAFVLAYSLADTEANTPCS